MDYGRDATDAADFILSQGPVRFNLQGSTRRRRPHPGGTAGRVSRLRDLGGSPHPRRRLAGGRHPPPDARDGDGDRGAGGAAARSPGGGPIPPSRQPLVRFFLLVLRRRAGFCECLISIRDKGDSQCHIPPTTAWRASPSTRFLLTLDAATKIRTDFVLPMAAQARPRGPDAGQERDAVQPGTGNLEPTPPSTLGPWHPLPPGTAGQPNPVIEHREITPQRERPPSRRKTAAGDSGVRGAGTTSSATTAVGARNLVFDQRARRASIRPYIFGRFISTYGRLKESGGEMRLAGAAGTVRETFRLTGLDRRLSSSGWWKRRASRAGLRTSSCFSPLPARGRLINPRRARLNVTTNRATVEDEI